MTRTRPRHRDPNSVPAAEPIALGDHRVLTVRRWPGEGEPIVFLHGLLSSSAGWAETCAELDRPCIAIDLPPDAKDETLQAYGEKVMPAIAETVRATS